jgi:PelA/Pel-15E family pectate lyase
MKCSAALPAGLLLFALLGSAAPASAAIIGTNPPAQPLSLQRIAALPKADQPAWKEYLQRSDRQLLADQAFLHKEMRQHGLKEIAVPPEGRFNRLLPLNRQAEWYGEADARHIADVVVSFQTPAGGWSKNLNMTGNPRAPGMHFAVNNNSRFPGDADFDAPITNGWSYVGTFDNDATIMQLRFLARVISAAGSQPIEPYQAAFVRGLDYVFAAQYPNGGWPQVWPLQGGYHDGVTYNDNAYVNILTLLRDVADGTNEMAFVARRERKHATESLQRGLDFLLATQIIVDGRRTAWGQQYDPLTQKPTSARNYEMPSIAAGESAGITLFLMQLPHPDAKVVTAVHAAAAWFEKTGIRDVAYRMSGNDGRLLISAPGNGPIWSRYYEIGTDRPIFGERDKSIHDTVAEISKERRNGYSWYVDSGRRVLDHYSNWNRRQSR